VISPSMGPNVLLTTVEKKVRGLPGVHDCALYGNAKRFVTAIISPASPRPDLNRLSRDVVTLNATMREEQRIHAMVIAPEQFSVANGLLNSQLKLKRREIHRKYAEELELIYDKHNNDEFPPVPPVIVTAGADA
jgi:long-chain acyl-CoA synthetase